VQSSAHIGRVFVVVRIIIFDDVARAENRRESVVRKAPLRWQGLPNEDFRVFFVSSNPNMDDILRVARISSAGD